MPNSAAPGPGVGLPVTSAGTFSSRTSSAWVRGELEVVAPDQIDGFNVED